MSHSPRAPRAVDQRQAIGQRLRAYRLAHGYTNRGLADRIGCGTYQVTSVETVCRDVLLGTAIELAEAVGLRLVLADDFHLPLLDLTADEIDALVTEAEANPCRLLIDPHLRSALDKLTTTEETPDA